MSRFTLAEVTGLQGGISPDPVNCRTFYAVHPGRVYRARHVASKQKKLLHFFLLKTCKHYAKMAAVHRCFLAMNACTVEYFCNALITCIMGLNTLHNFKVKILKGRYNIGFTR